MSGHSFHLDLHVEKINPPQFCCQNFNQMFLTYSVQELQNVYSELTLKLKILAKLPLEANKSKSSLSFKSKKLGKNDYNIMIIQDIS